MANYRALTVQSGVNNQLQDANTLIVGTGITTNSGTNLSITAGGSNTISIGSLLSSNLTFDTASNHSVLAATVAATVVGINLTLTSGTGGVATASPAGTGGLLTLQAGTGGAGLTSIAGAVGGAVSTQGGSGGAGTTTAAGGAGGTVTIQGGSGGTSNGGGGGVGGAITIDGGAATGAAANGTITIGGTNAPSIAIGRSGITTTITGGLTQLTGAVSLTANGASNFTTSAGALTLTSAGVATWSTAAGALNLSGFSVLNLQSNGTTALQVASGTSIVVQAGATLSTTGSGNINLPNNGSSKFQIEGVAVSANVTSANFGTLTAGSTSDASALHTHGTLVSGTSQNILSGVTTSAFTPVTDNGLFAYLSGNATIAKTDATAIGTAVPCGVYEGTAGQIVISGLITDAVFLAGLTLAAGNRIYLAKTAGKLTNDTTAFTTGNAVTEVGLVFDASPYNGTSLLTAKVLLQFKTPIVL